MTTRQLFNRLGLKVKDRKTGEVYTLESIHSHPAAPELWGVCRDKVHNAVALDASELEPYYEGLTLDQVERLKVGQLLSVFDPKTQKAVDKRIVEFLEKRGDKLLVGQRSFFTPNKYFVSQIYPPSWLELLPPWFEAEPNLLRPQTYELKNHD